MIRGEDNVKQSKPNEDKKEKRQLKKKGGWERKVHQSCDGSRDRHRKLEVQWRNAREEVHRVASLVRSR